MVGKVSVVLAIALPLIAIVVVEVASILLSVVVVVVVVSWILKASATLAHVSLVIVALIIVLLGVAVIHGWSSALLWPVLLVDFLQTVFHSSMYGSSIYIINGAQISAN